MAFAQSSFAQFIASSTGRGARIVAGLVLIGIGLGIVRGGLGIVIAVIGLIPLGAGTFDVCVLSPLFGGPFQGKEIRGGGGNRAAGPTPHMR